MSKKVKTKPCKTCPFRSDRHFPLTQKRAVEIVNAVLGDSWFPCHKTTCFNHEGNRLDAEKEKPCIGAARFLENVRGDCRANLMFRLAVMVDKLDPSALDRSIPVYQSASAFIEGTNNLSMERKN
jgi:hypothetical protein